MRKALNQKLNYKKERQTEKSHLVQASNGVKEMEFLSDYITKLTSSLEDTRSTTSPAKQYREEMRIPNQGINLRLYLCTHALPKPTVKERKRVDENTIPISKSMYSPPSACL